MAILSTTHVNPAPGEPIETLETEVPNVACDGGLGSGASPLGHPLVYLTINKDGHVDCPYCGRRFVLKRSGKA